MENQLFLNILLGVYKNYNGEVLLNKIPLKSKDLKNLWNNICYIPQEPFFLNETIKYNISLSRNIGFKEENISLIF